MNDHYLYGSPKRIEPGFRRHILMDSLTTPLDPAHERAQQITGEMVTTEEVLTNT
jgi:hypothetical protein